MLSQQGQEQEKVKEMRIFKLCHMLHLNVYVMW